MSIFHKIGLSIFALSVAWGGGYWHGRQHGREAAIKAAIVAYQLREKINHETDNLNPRALCLALGGVPAECDDLLRGLAEAASN